MAFFVQAPIGSLVHMLTASSDFDATFDVSFENNMYITTSRCTDLAPSKSDHGGSVASQDLQQNGQILASERDYGRFTVNGSTSTHNPFQVSCKQLR